MSKQLLRKPVSVKSPNGEEIYIFFDPDHTHGDIINYVVEDVGFEETRMIVDQLEEDYEQDEQENARLTRAE